MHIYPFENETLPISFSLYDYFLLRGMKLEWTRHPNVVLWDKDD